MTLYNPDLYGIWHWRFDGRKIGGEIYLHPKGRLDGGPGRYNIMGSWMVMDEDNMTLAFDPTDVSPPRREGSYSLVVHKFAISEDKKTLTLV